MSGDPGAGATATPAPGVGGPLRLTYLIGRYPVLTETFIDREILQLIERGVDLKLVSIRQPDAKPRRASASCANGSRTSCRCRS